ncbi:MAG: serine/threonine protein kinase, partial [Candidatus Obscuribacterales bacterium]|nr:serine/threonine protein kinase [Candidatus Obscuribacterales bacterium]
CQQYMVIEFLEGKTLAILIEDEGALHEARALGFFIDICEALSYAHSKGILHRDIKPANVIIQRNNEIESAKILDFGILKSIHSENQKLTQTGAIIGSANYMSPEQCKGGTADPRSDIYAAACLMYETLVGKPPMADENELLVMSNHLNKQITTVPAKYGISKEMKAIILKALQKEPEKRFASIDEMTAALRLAKNAPIKRSNQKKIFAYAATIAIIFALSVGWVAFNNKTSALTIKTKTELSSARCPDIYNDFPQAFDNIEYWITKNAKSERKDIRHLTNALAVDAALRATLLTNPYDNTDPQRYQYRVHPYTKAFAKVLEQQYNSICRGKTTIEDPDDIRKISEIKVCTLIISMCLGNSDRARALVEDKDAAFDNPKIGNQKEAAKLRKNDMPNAIYAMNSVLLAEGNNGLANIFVEQSGKIMNNKTLSQDQAFNYLQNAIVRRKMNRMDDARRSLINAAEILSKTQQIDKPEPIKVISLLKELNNMGCSTSVERIFKTTRLEENTERIASFQRELARAYVNEGKLTEAITTLKSALEAAPRIGPN